MTYAAHTKVPVDRTKTEIERTLKRYGADRFAYFTEAGKAIIVFEAHNRRLRFDLPVPAGDSPKEQLGRRHWRFKVSLLPGKRAARLSDFQPPVIDLDAAFPQSSKQFTS